MNTTTLGTILAGMAAALGGGLVMGALTGLPLVFALAIVVGGIAIAFAAGVVGMALFAPVRRPLSVRRSGRRAPARAPA